MLDSIGMVLLVIAIGFVIYKFITRRPIEYAYFVSYFFEQEDTKTGHGRITLTTDQLITNAERVNEVEKHINKLNDFKKCVIINFVLLGKIRKQETENEQN